MNEQSLLSKVLPKLNQGSDIIVPPGDDCAAIDVGNDKLLLIATDQVIANIHYDKNITTPQEAAKKLVKRNISDIAAMGGLPAHAVLTIASACKDEKWYLDFFDGISAEANKWGISVCGGDLSSNETNNEVCTLTITGWVEKNKICLRSNAKDGDVIFCTGKLGNSYKSKHHLTFTPRIDAARFIAGKYTSNMMDLSDGIAVDLERMCKASDIGAKIELEKLPLRIGAQIENALSDGEDYELLFSVEKSKTKDLLESWPFKDLELTELGRFTNSVLDLQYVIDNKYSKVFKKPGFDHFSKK